jgi:NAD(P)-dependent dehydrogenase (short-subunit alcohol dehydrogenase family)
LLPDWLIHYHALTDTAWPASRSEAIAVVSSENLGNNHEFDAAPEASSAGQAVEALLEEVGEETQPQPAGYLGGLRGRTAIVSGGATGIGRRTAVEFARCGTNVAFNWLDLPGRSVAEQAAELEQELQQLEVRVLSQRVDVRDASAVNAFIQSVQSDLGGVHFLVNAAGVHRSAPLWNMTDEQWGEVLDVNLTGAFNMIRAVAPTFKSQRQGKIVNVSSIHAFNASFGVANYAASKAGLVGLTRSAAAELGPSNVNVNGIAPGYVRTEMLADVPEQVINDSLQRAALRRLPDAVDIAQVILFLCSEMARQITGQVIRVDAGQLG